MINQKFNRELFSGKTFTLAASRSVFQTAVVLNMQKFQFRSQSFVSFLIQDTLMGKGILLPENTKNWKRDCYDLALWNANVDIEILEFLIFRAYTF